MQTKSEYAEKQDFVRRLAMERSHTAVKRAALGQGGVEASRFQMYTSFLDKLSGDLETKRNEMSEAEQKVKAQEKVVRRASINRKALETLKGYRLETFLKESEQEEQKLLDELLVNKGWRQS